MPLTFRQKQRVKVNDQETEKEQIHVRLHLGNTVNGIQANNAKGSCPHCQKEGLTPPDTLATTPRLRRGNKRRKGKQTATR